MSQTATFRTFSPPFGARPAPQLYNDPQKSPEWLARRTEQTASPCAANIGLSPYEQRPADRWAIMAGLAVDDFRGNVHTEYGERYEPRVRAICRAMLGPAATIDEWGMFRDRYRRHLGISPDGETNALRIVGSIPSTGERIDWRVGKMMVEIKTSRAHFYPVPRVSHVAQLQLQMYVMNRAWGILHYWSRDRTRAWMMQFDRWGFARWMMLRLDLMHEHVVRRVPVTADNPFFNDHWRDAPWYRGGGHVADWLQARWFGAEHTRCAPGEPDLDLPLLRPPISSDAWAAELRSLEITPEQWDERYPDSAPRLGGPAVDVAFHATPPKPRIYLIYEYERPVPGCEIEFEDDRCVVDQPEDNRQWFADAFPHVSRWAEAQRDVSAEHALMPRLLIERVESVPNMDEPTPCDGRAEDTADEQAAYEQRLAKFVQQARDADAEKQRRRDIEDRARERMRQMRLPTVAKKNTEPRGDEPEGKRRRREATPPLGDGDATDELWDWTK